jgi:hypothetical protein
MVDGGQRGFFNPHTASELKTPLAPSGDKPATFFPARTTGSRERIPGLTDSRGKGFQDKGLMDSWAPVVRVNTKPVRERMQQQNKKYWWVAPMGFHGRI